jgi:Na+/phosphate symporter
MNDKEIRELREMQQRLVERADEAIRAIEEAHREVQRNWELQKEELRRARRPGLIRALFE